MQSFKQYLKEDKVYPWQCTTNEQLFELGWKLLNKNARVVVKYSEFNGNIVMKGFFNKKGTFTAGMWPDFSNTWLIEYEDKFYIPFQLDEFWPDRADKILIIDSWLKSFIGMPSRLNCGLAIRHPASSGIKSVEGIPSDIQGDFEWNGYPEEYGMSKVIKRINGDVQVPSKYKGFLSFLTIESIQDLFTNTDKFVPGGKEKLAALDIVADHLKGDKDLLDCQEELITANLKEFAKL